MSDRECSPIANISNYREVCLREKGEICHICGATEDILVHHIDGRRGNNYLDNLLPVCREHHSMIHSRHPDVEKWVRKLGYRPLEQKRMCIEVGESIADELYDRSIRGERYDDVLLRLFERADELEECREENEQLRARLNSLEDDHD